MNGAEMGYDDESYSIFSAYINRKKKGIAYAQTHRIYIVLACSRNGDRTVYQQYFPWHTADTFSIIAGVQSVSVRMRMKYNQEQSLKRHWIDPENYI